MMIFNDKMNSLKKGFIVNVNLTKDYNKNLIKPASFFIKGGIYENKNHQPLYYNASDFGKYFNFC